MFTMLVLATLLSVLDSIAAGVDVFSAAVGVIGTEAGTVSKAAADNRDLLATVNDYTVQADLLTAFTNRASMVRGTSLYSALQGQMIQRALDRHYGAAGNGDLNQFLKNNDARVHDHLRLSGMQIDARNVFVPFVLDPVALYDGTGAGTGTFTAGSDVDSSLYAETGLEVVVTVQGPAARTLELTLKKFNAADTTRNVVIPSNAALGSTVNVGAGADRFLGVRGIVTIGADGQAADAYHVRSKIERAIAL